MAKKTITGEYRTMTAIAKKAIREAIISNVYQPGTHLIPGKMELELNLGKMAIRDALKELTGSGLVVSIPNKGTVVAEPFSPEEVREVFEIRYLLEGKAAYIATPKISESELRELEKHHKRMCRRGISPKDYFIENKAFHMIIYRASGWKILCQLYTQLIDKTQTFRNIYQGTESDTTSLNKDHQNILEALKEKQPAKVKKCVVANIRNGFKRLMKLHREKQRDSGGTRGTL